MNNNYDIVISCGSYFKPTLNGLMHGEKGDKYISMSGDVSLADVKRTAMAIASTTFEDRINDARNGGRPVNSGIANAFIFLNKKIILAASVSYEESSPIVDIYDARAID